MSCIKGARIKEQGTENNNYRGMWGWGHPLLNPGAAEKLCETKKIVSAPAEQNLRNGKS